MEKKNVGRPKIENPKKYSICFRMTTEERSALGELAKETGKSISALILDALYAEYRRAKEEEENGGGI